MTYELSGNVFQLGRYNNYLIAGNICNAFALGEVGSSDDFFLIGAEPEDESSYPLMTGNVLDSEGILLFRLVRNVLVFNPSNCSKIIGDQLGYELHDSAGKLIFKVSTRSCRLPGGDESFVTTLAANFYNRRGERVFQANSGEPDEHIEATVKAAYGFSGAFGLAAGMSQDEVQMAALAVSTAGALNQILKGDIRGQRLELDGKVLLNAHVDDCDIHIKEGNFAIAGGTVENSRFHFEGPALNILRLIQANSPTKS